MRVRALDQNGDMQFGASQENFLRDQPEAPAQCAMTRLAMNVGEWWLNLKDGTPWRTQVLGRRTEATRDPIIRARVLGTQGVTAIDTYASQQNRDTRGFAVQVVVKTAYGAKPTALPTYAPPTTDVRLDR